VSQTSYRGICNINLLASCYHKKINIRKSEKKQQSYKAGTF